MPGVAHLPGFLPRFLQPRFDGLIQSAIRGPMRRRRKFLPDRLMRALLVELLAPTVKTLLLRNPIRAGRRTAFAFHRSVHALVTAVVLRTSRPCELHADSQSDPPHTQAAQPAAEPALNQSRGLERRISGPDSFWPLDACPYECPPGGEDSLADNMT